MMHPVVGADHLSQSDPIVGHGLKTMENKPPMAGNGFYKPPIKMVITHINHVRNLKASEKDLPQLYVGYIPPLH